MRRVLSGCLGMLLVFVTLLQVPASAAGAAPSRMINVVYDDSGSMFVTDGVTVDTWCQAKYSMEVFAAMLGETDTMHVYYMSDYEGSTSAAPRITLDGKDGSEANVAKVHSQMTVAGNTPFNSVRKAYADLTTAEVDEKWLVILTDGEFQGVDGMQGMDAFLAEKADDIKVMFLGMGAKADGITEKREQNIFYVAAETNEEILSNITDICTRIFNSNKLEVGVSAKNFSFDIPMGELIVFAQGANVEIQGIQTENGTMIKSSKMPVEVKYSECDATNYSNAPTRDLLGSIATFRDDFASGQYSVDVSGAETIEIYYKPNVEVAAYLTDSNGEEVSDLSNLASGDYTISFGFVKGGTNEKVAASALLGEVSYEAIVTNNGVTHDAVYSNGDELFLEEGDLVIEVTAYYLDYNSVSTTLHYSIYKDKTIEFSVEENPLYIVESGGFQEVEPIRVRASLDGNEFTQEQWDMMQLPVVQLSEVERNFVLEEPLVEKSEKVGEFWVTPQLPEGKPSCGTYTDTDYQLIYQESYGGETWRGELDGTLKMQDTRSWFERNRDMFLKLLTWLIIVVILAGYLPLFKKYLPKALKKKPYIKCIPSEPGEKRKDRNGLVEKNFLSTIIPYVPQRGTIKYVPKGITGCPTLTVRAIKGRRMAVTNIKAFAGKDYISFDGETIKKDVKKFETGASVGIRVKKGSWTYVCSPNQSN